jgi:4-phospho-D-threonate 3-dehydrogenase / 4-phospho-D-erythronate 3-dehydrogenase
MTGITMGDPNGVGPEILLRAYQQKLLPEDIIVVGDLSVLEFCSHHLGLKISFNRMSGELSFKKGELNVLDQSSFLADDLEVGKISEKAGNSSLKYIEEGTRLALGKKISSLVTLPVSKEAIRMTEKDFSGHTGYLAKLCNVKNYTMMLVAEKLIVTHVSTHVSLREAINRVKKDQVLNVIILTDVAVRKLRPTSRIAVAGLNPHAGENNAFGKEDSSEISPAVEEACRLGYNVTGPVAADTVFYQALKGNYDAVVCMYHDQGHIAIKILDFESAVNITLGLPFVRTSVDHGTAFDIAYKGIASIKSLVNACRLARQLV